MQAFEDYLQELVKCTGCGKLPSSINSFVFQCASKEGHIFCTVCRHKLPKCSGTSCTAKLTSTSIQEYPIRIMEDLLANFLVACKNSECTFKVTIPSLKGHMENCNFRPVECQLLPQTNCNHSKINWKDLSDHVSQVHKAISTSLGQNGVSPILDVPIFSGIPSPMLIFNAPEDSVIRMFELGNIPFVLTIRRVSGIMEFWVNGVLPDDEAKKYQATICIIYVDPVTGSTETKYTHTLRVSTLRMKPEEIQYSLFWTALPLPSIIKMSTQDTSNGKWTMKYRLKIQKSQ